MYDYTKYIKWILILIDFLEHICDYVNEDK